MKRLRIVIVAIVLSVGSSYASEYGGPPSQEEVIGIWEMVPFPKEQKLNPWPLPYQWFQFDAEGTVKSFMTSEEGSYTKGELKALFDSLEFESPIYTLKGQFMVITNPSVDGYKEIWGVNIFRKSPGGPINNGDFVMSLVGGEDGAPVYYRLLRAVK